MKTWHILAGVAAVGALAAMAGGGGGGGKSSGIPPRIPKPKPGNDDDSAGRIDESFAFGADGSDGEAAVLELAELEHDSNRDLELEVRMSVSPKPGNNAYDGRQPCSTQRWLVHISGGDAKSFEGTQTFDCPDGSVNLASAVKLVAKVESAGSRIVLVMDAKTGLLSGPFAMTEQARLARVQSQQSQGDNTFVAFKLDVVVDWRWLS